MPRILCLHGLGTSSSILEAQSASFRYLLGDNYVFEFYEGTDDWKAAEGIAAVFPGPYKAYYNRPTPYKVQEAHEILQEIIEEDGPFDGAMGFSQGAALIAGVLLRHQMEHPNNTPPFRFFISLCGNLPFSWDFERGIDVSEEIGMGQKPEECPPEEEWVARRFEPATDAPRIQIPTVHVIGKNDRFYAQSMRLLEFCDKTSATVYEDSFGHEVPKWPEVSKKICEIIETCVRKSEFLN